MAKFCANCGTELDQNALFCGNCGAKQAEAPAPAPAPAPMAQPAPQATYEAPAATQYNAYAYQPQATYAPQAPVAPARKKSGFPKLAIILGSIALGILALVLIISLAFPGPKATVKKFMKAVESGNAEKLVNLMPDFYFEDEFEKEEAIEIYEEMYEDLEYEDFTYEIKDIRELKSSEIEDMQEMFEYLETYYDDFNASDVTDYRIDKVKYQATVDGETEKDTMEILLIKYQGKWCIYEFDY